MDAAGEVQDIQRLLPGFIGHALAQFGAFFANHLVLLGALANDPALDCGHKPIQRQIIFGRHGPANLLFVQNGAHLIQKRLILGYTRVHGRMIQMLERFGGGLGQVLDVDAPAGELGGQPGVLTLAADGQRKLIVGHDDDGRLAFFRMLFQKDVGDAGRAERLGNENALVVVPFDHVDLFVVQFANDALDAYTAHADARAHRVDPMLEGLHGDLGALAGLASDALDLDLAVIDLRHFQLQQAAQQVAVVTADDDLRAAIRLANFQNVDANLVVGAIAFSLNLMALGHDRLCPAQPDGDVLAADALHRAVDELAFAAGEILEEVFALGFTHLLQQDLLGGLRGNAAETLGCAVDHDQIAQFRVDMPFLSGGGQSHLGAIIDHVFHNFFLGEDRRIAGARIDFSSHHLIGAEIGVAPVGRNEGRLQCLKDVLFGETPLLTYFVESQDKFAFHGNRSNLFSFALLNPRSESMKQKKWVGPLFRRQTPDCSENSLAYCSAYGKWLPARSRPANPAARQTFQVGSNKR